MVGPVLLVCEPHPSQQRGFSQPFCRLDDVFVRGSVLHPVGVTGGSALHPVGVTGGSALHPVGVTGGSALYPMGITGVSAAL